MKVFGFATLVILKYILFILFIYTDSNPSQQQNLS